MLHHRFCRKLRIASTISPNKEKRKNTKQNKTRKGKMKRRRGRTGNPTRYIRRDRVRIARSTLEGVGEGGHEAESVGCRRRSLMAFGFWLRDGVFDKEARQHHTGTPSHRRTPKERNAHLVRFGHVNTTAKLSVEAGWNTAEAMATLDGCPGHATGQMNTTRLAEAHVINKSPPSALMTSKTPFQTPSEIL